MFFRLKHDQSKQRFSIKKFKLGVASVLVGISFLGQPFSPTVFATDPGIVASTVDLGMSDASDETAYTGQSVSESVTIKVTGTDKTYTGTYLEYVVEENGPNSPETYLTVSGYGSSAPAWNATTKTYTTQVGTLISGSEISLQRLPGMRRPKPIQPRSGP